MPFCADEWHGIGPKGHAPLAISRLHRRSVCLYSVGTVSTEVPMRAIVLIAFVLTVGFSGTAGAAPTLPGASNSEAQEPTSRRDTCWRTNRSTGQKFRIC